MPLFTLPPNAGYVARVAASSASPKEKQQADYICTGTNDDVTINAAITAVVASSANGGQILLSSGMFNTTSTITTNNYIILRGQGRKTTIAPSGTGFAAISAFGSSGSPLLSPEVWDLSINCTNVVDTGSFNVASKGLFLQYMKYAKFVNLYVYNAPASGIGTDFMVDSIISHCVVENAGRQFAALGGTVGGNGIGIGTGVYTYENVAISDCHAINSGNNGIMFEEQFNNVQSKGATISNCAAIGNKVGFRVSSNRKIAFSNCDAANNTSFGFQVGVTYIGSPDIPKQVILSNCHSYDNGSDGINVSIPTAGVSATPTEQVSITGCQIENNTGIGINLVNTSDKFLINNNIIALNTQHGININTSAAAMTNILISGNTICNNSTSSAGTYQGISISQNSTGSLDGIQIQNNKIFDGQTTKTQANAVVISGTHTNTSIINNDVRNNLNGSLGISTSSTCSIVNNKGFNPVGVSTISVTASPFTYTAGKSPEAIYISGGTVSSITKGGTTIFTASPATVLMAPGQSIIVTYSAAPTMIKDSQ